MSIVRVAAYESRCDEPLLGGHPLVVPPRATSRGPRALTRWTVGSQVTSQTSSHSAASPPSTSLIASMTTAGAPAALRVRRSAARIRGRTAGMDDRLELAERRRVGEHDARRAPPGPGCRPARRHGRAEVREDRVVGRLAGRGRPRGRPRRRRRRRRPARRASAATCDLPQPMGPVMPILTVRTPVTGARSSSSSQASSASARARSTSASSLVTRRISTKFDGDRRGAHRELELALAQAEPRQLRVERLPLPAVGVLRQLRRASGARPTGAAAGAAPSGAGAAAAGVATGVPAGPLGARRRRSRRVEPGRPRFARRRGLGLDGPAVGDRRAPGAVAAVERDRERRRRRPTAARRSSRAGAGRGRRRAIVAGDSARNASIASRAAMSRWFVGSSSSSRFDGRIPSSASSSRDRSPPDSEPDLLEHVVAAEQEPREVAARLARA